MVVSRAGLALGSLAIATLLLIAVHGGRSTDNLRTRNLLAGARIAATDTRIAAPASREFVDVVRAAGIRYRWTVPGERPFNILQSVGFGCAFLDYDNDGNLDILFVNEKPALYRGDGHGHFTDVTKQAGLDELKGHFIGCAVGDYDNDGYEDIYLSAYRGGVLLRNDRGKVFRDVTRQAGIAPQPWGTSCSFADVDGDGKLDLYIANYAKFGPETYPQMCRNRGHITACAPRFYKPERGVLYHQEANGTFKDVTREWHAEKIAGKTLGVAFADYDGSGHPSLDLANDEVAGDLLRNDGKHFTNIGITSGTAYDLDGGEHGGMGVDWGDYDNDGRPDLVVATFQGEAKSVYHNEGNDLFEEVSVPLGLAEKTFPYVAFGVKWIDYDNDGWLDVILANGHVQDNITDIDPHASFREPVQLFHNALGRRFTDTSSTGGEGLKRRLVGRGLAIGDYDNDGKIDVLIVDCEGSPLLLHNEFANTDHWLSIKLQGVTSNRDGLGAMVTVTTPGLRQSRICAADGSYLSASDERVHVGLGAATFAETVTVKWPSGHTDAYSHIAADQRLLIVEGAAAPAVIAAR